MIIGIDTGSNGAAVAMDLSGNIVAEHRFADSDGRAFAEFLRAMAPARIYIEQATYHGGRGKNSNSKFEGHAASYGKQGENYAGPLWVCQALGYDVRVVRAQTWQAFAATQTHGAENYDDRKLELRAIAQRLSLDGRTCAIRIGKANCDAILIAEFGRLAK